MWLECWIECDVCHQAMEISHIIQLPDGSYVCDECMDDRRI